MTKISDICDSISTLLETTLAGYTRLPNPYVVPENTFLNLTKGYGIGVGPGFDTNRETCKINWQRSFNIILVNRMIALDNDTDRRFLIEKDLLDAHDAFRQAIYMNSLGGLVFNAYLTSDQGISFIDAEQLKFLSLELEVTLEYQE